MTPSPRETWAHDQTQENMVFYVPAYKLLVKANSCNARAASREF